MTDQQLNTKTLSKEILDLAGVDPSEIAHVTRFIDPRNTEWEFGKAPKVKAEWLILSMFLSGEDVRVYCAPTADKDAAGNVVPFARLTLSRQSGSLVCESMGLGVFKQQMVEEFVSASSGKDESEVEGMLEDLVSLLCKKGVISQQEWMDEGEDPTPAPPPGIPT